LRHLAALRGQAARGLDRRWWGGVVAVVLVVGVSASDGLHRHHAQGKQKKGTLDKTLLVHGFLKGSKRCMERSDTARCRPTQELGGAGRARNASA
jgi:hypothetical protein